MTEMCPVCVFTATNVNAETLRGIECYNCGGDLGTHPVETRQVIEPGKAYAVNRDTFHEWPLASDSERAPEGR